MLLETDSYRDYLAQELARRMRSNPRYSQRAFARQLGMSPGELSEVLKAKRKLSLKSALRVAHALGLNPTETKHLLYLTQVEKGRELPEGHAAFASPETPNARELSLDLFHVISDWYCFALLNLADTADFREDHGWIARRLGISKIEVAVALERLQRVGLLTRRDGRLCSTPDYVMSPAGISSEAIRNGHRALLGKAEEALDFQGVDEREISGIGLAVDPKHLPSIKKDINEFLDQIVAKYSKGRKSEVYQLEVAFFRLTERGENRNET